MKERKGLVKLKVKDLKAELPSDFMILKEVIKNDEILQCVIEEYLPIAQTQYWDKDTTHYSIVGSEIYFSSPPKKWYDPIKSLFKKDNDEYYINYVTVDEYNDLAEANSGDIITF